jgi:hypothetical protein
MEHVEDANTIRPVLEYAKGNTPGSNTAIPSPPPLDSILARREDGERGWESSVEELLEETNWELMQSDLV